MSPTCKLNMFHEYKALIKFANKDGIISKTSRKFPMHYVNTTFEFLGNSLIENGKYFLLNHHIFVYRNKYEVSLIYYSFSVFFLEDKKAKKSAVALKFLYILTVLSLNYTLTYQGFLLVLFACVNPFPFYKSSKRRNHLKPENFETLFLLSALKVSIKYVTSYQAEMK